MDGLSCVSSSSSLRRGRSALRNGMTVMGALSLVATLVLAGCSGQPLSTREKGTLGGGLLGAQALVR